MTSTEALMQGMLNDDEYEEEWEIITQAKGKYTLSKNQARIVQQAIATGNRSTIMFETFAIAIPYIVEFYMVKRFLKNTKQLPARATEEEYKPMPPEKWEEFKKQAYAKIGKPLPSKK